MLILTRKPGQSLYIGDNIKVTVVETKGHQIRIGIDAPKDFRIYREEIYLQIMEENQSAAQASRDSEMGGLENLGMVWKGSKSGESQKSGKGLSLGAAKVNTKVNAPMTRQEGKSISGSAGNNPEILIRKKRPKHEDE